MKRSQPLRRVSSKRAKQRKKYSKLHYDYLMSHLVCDVCKTAYSDQIHHIAGRIGAKLNDQSDWLAVCLACHDRIHLEGHWAKAHGYKK